MSDEKTSVGDVIDAFCRRFGGPKPAVALPLFGGTDFLIVNQPIVSSTMRLR
jgi:hypothetical protein